MSAKKEPEIAPSMPASSGSRLSPLEKKRQLNVLRMRPSSSSRSSQASCFSVKPPGIAGGGALEQHVHFVVGRRPDAHRPAD